jgi:hypothetical protein
VPREVKPSSCIEYEGISLTPTGLCGKEITEDAHIDNKSIIFLKKIGSGD